MKPFLAKKGNLSSDITLAEGEKIISEDTDVAQKLNEFFGNCTKSLNIQDNSDIINSTSNINDPLDIAIQKFSSHPSVLKIAEKVQDSFFNFQEINLKDVEKEINSLNSRKYTTSGSIPVKSLKENIDITGKVLHKIFSNSIDDCKFPDNLKLAEITPLFKAIDRTNKKNYRPISILSGVSKIFEKLLQKQLSGFIDKYLYKYMFGYRKGYSTQHALLTLLEKWRISLDKGGYAGALIMDLSKAFDTINHE